VGFIDLPIMREKTTNWPLIPGSAMKGVLRAYWDDRIGQGVKKDDLDKAFGAIVDDQSNSGALAFTDARMVCLAVRSLYGTFAWATCPMALRRLARDLGSNGDQSVPPNPEDNSLLVPEDGSSALTGPGNKVFFNDLDFTAKPDASVQKWADKLSLWLFSEPEKEWRSEFVKRFAVLPDDSFDFFCETGTEVSPHVRIDPKTKTVQTGALWFQESIPAESIMAGMVWCDWVFSGSKDQKLPQDKMDRERERLLESFCLPAMTLQIGGNATTGKGRVKCLFTEKGGKHGK